MRLRTHLIWSLAACLAASAAWAGLSGCRRAAADDRTVQVAAAASLTDVLTEAAKAFEKETGAGVRFDFASSGLLAKKIQAGAPVDAFLSASTRHMDRLASDGLVARGSRRVLLTNSLVVVVAAEATVPMSAPADLAGPKVRRIALADPAHAPAGRYAKEALTSLGLWNTVHDRLVYGSDVRGALSHVCVGTADAAVVYRTDAAIAGDRVRVAMTLPADSHSAIRYEAGVIAGSAHEALARKFLAYLARPETAKIFRAYGFVTDLPDRGTRGVD